MRIAYVGLGYALAVAIARSPRKDIDPRLREIRLRPDHIPKDEAPSLERASVALLLRSPELDSIYRIDTNPRSIRGTIAKKRSRRKKKR